jgi:hypothetical protein
VRADAAPAPAPACARRQASWYQRGLAVDTRRRPDCRAHRGARGPRLVPGPARERSRPLSFDGHRLGGARVPGAIPDRWLRSGAPACPHPGRVQLLAQAHRRGPACTWRHRSGGPGTHPEMSPPSPSRSWRHDVGVWTADAAITLRVPEDHPTIQAAIQAASPGDVIDVARAWGAIRSTVRHDRRAGPRPRRPP